MDTYSALLAPMCVYSPPMDTYSALLAPICVYGPTMDTYSALLAPMCVCGLAMGTYSALLAPMCACGLAMDTYNALLAPMCATFPIFDELCPHSSNFINACLSSDRLCWLDMQLLIVYILVECFLLWDVTPMFVLTILLYV